MEPELPHTHGHHYEPQQLSSNPAGIHPAGVGGEEEGHPEKQSMFKRVKAKARKIKNSLTKQGHGQEPDNGRADDENEEEDDVEDEVMVKDPEIQGVPITLYESAAVRSASPAPAAGLGEHFAGINPDKPSPMAKDHYDSAFTDPAVKPFDRLEKEEEGKHTDDFDGFETEGINPPEHKQIQLSETEQGHDLGGIGAKHINLTEHKQIPLSRTEQGHDPAISPTAAPTDKEEKHGGIGRPTGLEEDTHGHYVQDVSSNVQGKTIDPSSKVYESAAVRSTALAPEAGLGQHAAGVDLEKPSLMVEDHFDSSFTDPPVKPFKQWEKEEEEGEHTGNLGGFGAKGTNPLPEHKHIPLSRRTRTEQGHGPGTSPTGFLTDMEEKRGDIGKPTGLEGDTHGHHVQDVSSNVEGKNIDPSGKVYEPAAVRSAAPAPEAGLGQHAAGVNLEKPSFMVEDRFDSSITDLPVKPFGKWEKEEEEGKHAGSLGGFGAKGINPSPEHKHIPLSRTEQEHGLGMNRTEVPTGNEKIHGGIGTGTQTSLEEDPHGPYVRDVSSNVQAKTIDPSGKGSEEAVGITPILQSFDKVGISDTTDPKPKTGQGEKLFTPEPPLHEIPVSVPKTNDAEHSVTMPHKTWNPSNQSSTLAPEPIGHENPDSHKSYDSKNPETMPGDTLNLSNQSNQSSTFAPEPTGHEHAEYVPKSYDSTNPVPKSYDSTNPETTPSDTLNLSNQSSTNTEKIKSAAAAATSAVANTTQSAKNVMTSKLEQGDDSTTKSGSASGTSSTDYEHKIAAALPETLAPVASAGSAVTSKVTGKRDETPRDRNESVDQDKGVSVTEKLKPAEEDKALSQMITETLTKPENTKEWPVKSEGGDTGLVSDPIRKQEMEKPGEQTMAMEQMSESAGGEGEKMDNLSGGAGGGGMVDRFKGAVSSWWGGEGGHTQISPETSFGGEKEDGMSKDGGTQGVGGERRHEESSY